MHEDRGVNLGWNLGWAAAAGALLAWLVLQGPFRRRAMSRLEPTNRRVDSERLHRMERLAAVGALGARVVHDVRNPLFAISATLDAMEARFGTRPEFQRYVGALREQSDRLDRLMRDLLAASAIEPPALGRVPPAALADEAVRRCAPTAEAARVRLHNRIERALPEIAADREQAVLALRCAIENAIDRSAPGGEVEIAGRCEPDAGRTLLRLEIRDRGPAIPDQELARLFDPLRHPDHEDGLRMAIARRILEGHRGDVTVRNDVRGGAVATLRMPCGES